jgi:hypothetical protein
MYNVNEIKSQRSIKRSQEESAAWMYPILIGDELTVTSIVSFIAFRSPGPPAPEALVASAHAARQRQPSHPTAVRPVHQAHWGDQDTSTEEGASCARHRETDPSGSAVVHDAADGAVVVRRQKWGNYTGVRVGLVGAGAEG